MNSEFAPNRLSTTSMSAAGPPGLSPIGVPKGVDRTHKLNSATLHRTDGLMIRKITSSTATVAFSDGGFFSLGSFLPAGGAVPSLLASAASALPEAVAELLL